MNRNPIGSFIVGLLFIVLGIVTFSCADSQTTQSKVSSALQLQIDLRKEQIANPSSERLSQMKSLGMNVSNLRIQRIFIYVNQQLTTEQLGILQGMNVTVYADSWIPPVGNHPNGYYLADMPVDKLNNVAAEKYVIKLDTAEKESIPQQFGPQDQIP